MEGEGRSSEERRAAAEARQRARGGRAPGEDADADDGRAADPGETGWTRRERPEMSRYYAGGDVYARRRAIATGVIAGVVIILILLVVGC